MLALAEEWLEDGSNSGEKPGLLQVNNVGLEYYNNHDFVEKDNTHAFQERRGESTVG